MAIFLNERNITERILQVIIQKKTDFSLVNV
jgi:hypothetical protein